MTKRLAVAVGVMAVAALPVLASSRSAHGENGGHASAGHADGRRGGGREHAVPRSNGERGYGGGERRRSYGGQGYRVAPRSRYGRGPVYVRRYRRGYGHGSSFGLVLGGPAYVPGYYDYAPGYYDPGYYDVAPDVSTEPYVDGGYAPEADDTYEGPDPYSADDAPQSQPPSSGGLLTLAVRPLDATIYVDGRFRGTGRDASTLQLPEGRHRLEVVRPGFRTYTRDVDVNDDAPIQLSIILERR